MARQCCETEMGTRHEEWCHKSTALLHGYEKRLSGRDKSEDAKTSTGNTATISNPKRRVGWEFPGVRF